MKDSEKIKRLVEDYQKAQRVLDDLNSQCKETGKSDEYLLGRKILTSWWLRFIGIAYDLARSIKSRILYGECWSPNIPASEKNNIKYTDTLALYDYKIAVYTCVTGNYDQPQEPLFKPGNVDYILVTDSPLTSTGAWKCMDIRAIRGIPVLDDSRVSRYVKLHPHLFLHDYDYSIYIDGNIETVGDMRYLIHFLNQYGFVSNLHRNRDCIYEEFKKCVRGRKDNLQTMHTQIDTYRSAGMPEHYGLIEANLLVRDQHNPICIEIMERWWQEILKHSGRDQISLPFVLWEMGIPVSEIGRISGDVYKIPSIRIQPHSKG